MRIKILPLESWMKSEWSRKSCNLIERNPYYFKPNIYLIGDYCWFELSNGLAYEWDKNSFLYALRLYKASEYNYHQYDALKSIKIQKIATKKQLQLLNDIIDYKHIREVGRNSKLVFLKKCKKGF